MKYKALVLDLDGTTVVIRGQIPTSRVKDAIQKASQKIYVSIATGRILDGSNPARPVIDYLKLTGPCILDQGAQIYDPVKHRMIKEIFLDNDIVSRVVAVLSRSGAEVNVSDGNDDIPYDAQKRTKVIGVWIEDVNVKIIDVCRKELEHIPSIALHKIVGSRPGLESLEVTHISATKQFAIAEVAKILGIETREIIGVGDGYNDFPLLLACGLKVAMGNAVPELKAIADFIAPTVDEDGVATIIEKFILTS